MTVALNRPDELALHLRGALRNDVTVAELREVLLQTVVYCGIPAAHTAFKVAQEVLGPDVDGASSPCRSSSLLPSTASATRPPSSRRRDPNPSDSWRGR